MEIDRRSRSFDSGYQRPFTANLLRFPLQNQRVKMRKKIKNRN